MASDENHRTVAPNSTVKGFWVTALICCWLGGSKLIGWMHQGTPASTSNTSATVPTAPLVAEATSKPPDKKVALHETPEWKAYLATYEQKNTEEILKCIMVVYALHPDEPEPKAVFFRWLLSIAQLQCIEGNRSDAEKSLRSATKLDPSNEEARRWTVALPTIAYWYEIERRVGKLETALKNASTADETVNIWRKAATDVGEISTIDVDIDAVQYGIAVSR